MKNTIKNSIIATTVCSLLALSTVSFADVATYQQERQSQNFSEKKLAKISRKLGLSETQQTELQAIKAEESAELKSLKPAMKAFKEQVKSLMSADTFDEPAFVQLQAGNQDVFAAMALIKAKSKFAMKRILTEEQLEKFNAMKSKHKRSRR